MYTSITRGLPSFPSVFVYSTVITFACGHGTPNKKFQGTNTAICVTNHNLIERYHKAKNEAFARLAEAHPITEETIHLLRDLQGRDGLRSGLVTTALGRIVWPVLQAAGLESVFDISVFGDDVPRPKPAPDAYLLAAQKLAARRVVVFEDTAPGMASARAAGLDVVQILDCRELGAVVRRTLGLDAYTPAAG